MTRIKQLRQELGWSIAELARRAQMNATDVSRIERSIQVPYPIQKRKIALAIEWDGNEDDLFQEVDR